MIVVAVSALLLLTFQLAVFAQENDDPAGSDADSGIPATITGILGILGGGAAGSVLTYLIGPYVKERFTLRENYFVPYSQWCSRMSAAIAEFEELCRDVVQPTLVGAIGKQPRSDVDIIFHMWDMHRNIEEGYKWLGKMRKDYGFDSESYVTFNVFFDRVDRAWHAIEDNYPALLDKQSTPDDIRVTVAKLSPYQRFNVAQEVRREVMKGYYIPRRFKIMYSVLSKSTPGRF